ncbi:hypothetical protein Ari01nite_97040 [Paractinoplanes rishiriensis]|uniref:Uncharacterized protein n=1 Tax=Paractinoplanes rishiriensis TaxID=1050105 RepID=A0A919K9I4_9ACTN|nr:hypothetical protein Ari01nite_97040 [Actinoplanes rishiriensis]
MDQQEVLRWFDEGRKYKWMVEQYRERGIETTEGMWSEFRNRHGLQRRNVQDDSLIPWRVQMRHRLEYPAVMLRLEARRRHGGKIRREDLGRLTSWLKRLDEAKVVIAYDPDTERGFAEVPREPGDVDIVRAPSGEAARQKRAGHRKGEEV